MKNADQPVYPSTMTRVGEDSYRGYKEGDDKLYSVRCSGLTKREAFAMAAMQGIIASYAGLGTVPDNDRIAEKSVSMADALLQALEK